METFLKRPVEALNRMDRVLTLSDVSGIHHRPIRKPSFSHTQDDHNHGHLTYDMHIWLDPENGRIIAQAIADQLAKIDPPHRDHYLANAEKFQKHLEALSTNIETQVDTVRGRRYLVLHDAYRAFEDRYDIHPTAIISISPEQKPGPRHINEIQQLLSKGKISCIFIEPQFSTAWVDIIIADTKIRKSRLDPLGSSLIPGPNLYLELLSDLSTSLHDCLSQ